MFKQLLSNALSRKPAKGKRALQAGFTLIEILVALSILSVLALLASNSFDGSRTKAQVMISVAKQIGDANIQLKIDTGCFVNNPSALFDTAAAQVPANNACGRTFGNTWARPYLSQYPTSAAGNLRVDKISAEVEISLPAHVVIDGMKKYFVRFDNVPKDIIKQALIECNGTDERQGNLGRPENDRCRTTSNLADETPGTFDMLYSATR